MMSRSTFLHLRFPFSFFLLPVFLFATFHSDALSTTRFWVLFLCIHFFLYPASNGYNSFFDKDEGSIGGLKTPPKVQNDLFIWANIFDLIALTVGFSLQWEIGVGFLAYILVSRAYSYPGIRLKKFPLIGLLSVSVFQGYAIFILTLMGIKSVDFQSLSAFDHFGGLICSVLLFGSYPMTQIYQHEEDNKNGDQTISLILGVTGTFIFSSVFFSVSIGLFFLYFQSLQDLGLFWILVVCLLPTLIYFFIWQLRTLLKNEKPGFDKAMILNLVSSSSLNIFFLIAWRLF
jgi:4-hydroxybenzoate polyprenyltransferase